MLSNIICLKHCKFLFIAGIFSLVISCSSEPKNFDDCILKHVKAGMSDSAANLLFRTCRNKFPDKTKIEESTVPPDRQLSINEISLLAGRAALDYGDEYSGSIYNGNSNLTLTQLDITVITTISGKKTPYVYRDEVSIPPKSTGRFSFKIIVGDKDASYSWSISSVKGRPTD